MARRYTERFLASVDREIAEGHDMIEAWNLVFRRALHSDGKMCLCGVLWATSGDLPEEVVIEARRFFEVGLEKLTEGGLSQPRALQVMATLEGAMLVANVLSKPSVFDEATAVLQ